jgi:FixJ family two-component response regulator
LSPPDAKLFVIDDDAEYATSLLRVLQSAGYAAEAFGSAREFLARATAEGPACVLVDLMMPDVDGLSSSTRWRVRRGSRRSFSSAAPGRFRTR